MKAYVYVSLKKTVLDPQGKTIQGALKKMGYRGLGEVRQGKYFELTLDGGLSKSEAETEVERIAREVLTNPVIEEYRFSLED
jgi:phosphoribosylformylglycinamidine synthase subunit PurS